MANLQVKRAKKRKIQSNQDSENKKGMKTIYCTFILQCFDEIFISDLTNSNGKKKIEANLQRADSGKPLKKSK